MKRLLASLALVLAGGSLAPAHAATERTQPILPAPAPVWPSPVVKSLPNGLVIAVFARPELPIVQLQLALPAGSGAEDSTQFGAAGLTASMLRAGTTSRTSQDFQRDLDQLGGVLGANVARDEAVVSVGFLAADLENGMELFSDAVINPIFPEEEFQLARRSAGRQLGQVRGNMGAIADERAWAAVFAPHPYGHPAGGTIGSLLKLHREDLQSFHRDRWRPDHALLVIAGDVNPERAFAAAGEWFGRWSGTSAPAPPPPSASAGAGRVILVDLPGAERAEIRLAQPGPGRGSAESVTWSLMAQALAATPSVTAVARPGWSPLRDAGLMLWSANVASDSVAVAVRRMRAAWVALAEKPPADAFVRSAAEIQRQTLPFAIETLGGLASAWQLGRMAGLGDEHLGQAATRLERAATSEAVAAAARAFAAPPAIVVAGSAARLRDRLAEFGTVVVQPLDELVAPRDTTPPPTPEQLRRGRELIDAALVAHGGAAKLEAIKSMHASGEIVVQMEAGPINGLFEIDRAEPYRLSYLTKMFDFTSRQVLDGTRGWALAGTDKPTVMDADSAGVAGLRAIYESDLLNALRTARSASTAPAWRGQEPYGDGTTDRVELRTPAGARVRFLLDERTHRVVAIDTAPSPDGVWHERRVFSDLRPVGGVWIPHREERRVDGTLVTTFRSKVITVNPPVNESLFKRPTK